MTRGGVTKKSPANQYPLQDALCVGPSSFTKESIVPPGHQYDVPASIRIP